MSCKPNYINKSGICTEMCTLPNIMKNDKCYGPCKNNDFSNNDINKCNTNTNNSINMKSIKFPSLFTNTCEKDYDKIFGLCYKKCNSNEYDLAKLACIKKSETYDRPIIILGQYKL